MSQGEVKPSENILCLPTELFEQRGIAGGFTLLTGTDVSRYVDGAVPQLRCDDLEKNQAFKQIIPYVLLTHQPVDGPLLVYAYRRTPKAGESRLHGKRSIGVGGHTKVEDGKTPLQAYLGALIREVEEEVHLGVANLGWAPKLAGTLYDDSDDVGKVHLGLISVVELASPDVEAREEDHADAGLVTVDELLADFDSLESWSKIVFKALLAPQPA